MIYEGANGIQALDLVGRKLPRDGGRAIMAYFKEVGDVHRRSKSRRSDEILCRAVEERRSTICRRRRCG